MVFKNVESVLKADNVFLGQCNLIVPKSRHMQWHDNVPIISQLGVVETEEFSRNTSSPQKRQVIYDWCWNMRKPLSNPDMQLLLHLTVPMISVSSRLICLFWGEMAGTRKVSRCEVVVFSLSQAQATPDASIAFRKRMFASRLLITPHHAHTVNIVRYGEKWCLSLNCAVGGKRVV